MHSTSRVVAVLDADLALERVLPDYGGRCITEVMPTLLAGVERDLVDESLKAASAVVLLVIDGLGWHQLQRHREHAPNIAAACDASEPITTVAPSTTATALTSLTTGATPGEHGLVGYRVPTAAGLMNALRWRARGREVSALVPPHELQPVVPFCDQPVAVVTRAEFEHGGFTAAHLRGGAFRGWHNTADLVRRSCDAVEAGFDVVFAYYDSLDTIAHVHGLGERYCAELAAVERLAVAMRDALPSTAALVVTADHGMVDVVDDPIMVAPEIVSMTASWSGEARLLWLHSHPGEAAGLAQACEMYAPIAEIAQIERILDERWLGPHVVAQARSRLGDVALVPRGLQAFTMPDEDRPQHPLIGRHGGLTAEEMMVPFASL